MIVVDASLAAEWVVPEEERSEQALALLRRTLDADEPMIAPTLLAFEMTNVVRQRVRRGSLGLVDALASLDDFLAMPIEFRSPPSMHGRALALAVAFDLPAAYDAHDLALIETAGCDLWTDDRRLLRQVGGRFPALRWIGDYRPSRLGRMKVPPCRALDPAAGTPVCVPPAPR